MTTETLLPGKEHYYINRKSRDRFHLGDPQTLSLQQEKNSALAATEAQVSAINRRLELLEGKAVKKLLPAQFHGMKLLHEVFHLLIKKVPGLAVSALRIADDEVSQWQTRSYLADFLEVFPPWELYRSKKGVAEYLGAEGRLSDAMEESFLVWLNNRNPALEQFSEFLSDLELKANPAYARVAGSMQRAMHLAGPVGSGGEELDELLLRPIRQAPDSILAQLRYIRLNWAELLEGSDLWNMLDETITLIEDEDRYLFFEKLSRESVERGGAMGEKEAHVPTYGSLADAPARYSHDSSWMPEVVMIAKSTYVWLDQLCRQYGRPISRLQEIPDEELDILAERGFTALWLIGLWERSPASRKIKQIQGNPEAKASAYALDKYEVADELGGYEGYLDLRNRAARRGIRLASDMVPNHTGIDSELVRERPDWFISSEHPPYPNYTYYGPNLSEESRYGIYIEDGYWNRSDAAVTFKRVDHLTGDTRYIYHGNDGTNMPWNDTAQLDFLNPEVREGVIRQIIQVAKMFPVIRFDAAMVLAKMHIQRLWFPLPGHESGVPSRGAYAMGMAEFEAAIPNEFWREVVDRVREEVPDTLLLAEAFWMLEGYFVRTLGMHRVYNSAFMHMLKKEDNASYRQLIKKTIEFDAEILKRYVNFMNNPDEDTAIAQFGKGDKYFGVCLMMVTMPGLPMIGHGQVEGLTEKYGMEYARAYYDEQPDGELVARHYREIFPIMKMRRLFAEVANFHLFDLFGPDGSVNENVFAYSNRLGDQSALVLYNNRYESADGWIRVSAGYLENGSIRQILLADALGLPDDDGAFTIFRDHASGLEFIRSCREIRDNGLRTILGGYRYNLFIDFRTVRPSRLRPYDRVCKELDGRGVGSIEREALSMSLRPLHGLITDGIRSITLDSLQETLGSEDDAIRFGRDCKQLMDAIGMASREVLDTALEIPDNIGDKAAMRYCAAVLAGSSIETMPGHGRLKAALGLGHADSTGYRQAMKSLIILECIQEMLESNAILNRQLIDDWLLDQALLDGWEEEATLPVQGKELVDLFSCLLLLRATKSAPVAPAARLMEAIRSLAESGERRFGSVMAFDRLHGKQWFREHRLALVAAWLSIDSIVSELEKDGSVQSIKSAVKPAVSSRLAAFDALEAESFISGYELGTLLLDRVGP